MDRLREIEVFVRVVETGSFTLAARSLGLSRASATTLVQSLESRLQIKLLHRTTRRVSVTSEGAIYYEEAGRLLRELGELESELGQSTASPKGVIRVDVPAAAGRHVIAPALPAFLARHPEITVRLGSTDRPLDLLDEGIDCVVRGGELHDGSLAARKLGEIPVLTCASPQYLARHGAPESPSALEGHSFVAFFSPKSGRVFEVDFRKGDTLCLLQPPHQVAANDADTWVALAVAGLGLLQAPCSPQLRSHIESGLLAVTMPDWTSDPLPLYVLYPPIRKLPAKVRVFVDWLVELYAEECRIARAFVDHTIGSTR